MISELNAVAEKAKELYEFARKLARNEHADHDDLLVLEEFYSELEDEIGALSDVLDEEEEEEEEEDEEETA